MFDADYPRKWVMIARRFTIHARWSEMSQVIRHQLLGLHDTQKLSSAKRRVMGRQSRSTDLYPVCQFVFLPYREVSGRGEHECKACISSFARTCW